MVVSELVSALKKKREQRKFKLTPDENMGALERGCFQVRRDYGLQMRNNKVTPVYSNDHSIAKTEGAWISTFLVSTCGSVVGDYDDYIIANYATTPVHELAATVCQRAPGFEDDDDDWRDDDDDDGGGVPKGLGVCPVGLDMSKANTHDDGWTVEEAIRKVEVPDAALVFSGHEYMLMNLRFSHWLDESDENVATALREVATRRHHSFTTQPSSMAVERRVNPFFRVKERAFLGKIEELYVAMRRSARKKWYRRYVPDWLDRSAFIAAVEGPDKRDAEMGKLARKIGGTGPDFADISRDPDEPSAIECVKGIKTCQELIQYRHAIDQATAGEGGAEVDEDESPAAEAPEPGPVRVDA